MKKIIPMRWPVSGSKYQPRTAPDGLPIIGPRDDVREVLRHVVPFIFSPNIIAALSVDAGIHIDGDQTLKFSQRIAANYSMVVDRMCGGAPGRYAIPDAILAEDGSGERAEFVAMLDEILALLRSGEAG